MNNEILDSLKNGSLYILVKEGNGTVNYVGMLNEVEELSSLVVDNVTRGNKTLYFRGNRIIFYEGLGVREAGVKNEVQIGCKLHPQYNLLQAIEEHWRELKLYCTPKPKQEPERDSVRRWEVSADVEKIVEAVLHQKNY